MRARYPRPRALRAVLGGAVVAILPMLPMSPVSPVLPVSPLSSVLPVLPVLAVLAGCGEPELNDEARQAEGSPDPTGETGSPAPGLPPQPPAGVPPG